MKKEQSERLAELAGMPLHEIGQEFISIAEMQRRIMPDPERLEVFGEYDIFGMTLPIGVVGGDFYHFIDLAERFGIQDKMGIAIADASGHGLPAAMLIRDFNTALYMGISFQSYYVQDTTPLLFTKINRRMYRSSQENQFISAFYAELRLNGILRYINAGHYSPFLFKEREIVPLDVGGPLLGAFRRVPAEYEVGEVLLEAEDVLVCYTDGIVEAINGTEEYGIDRLKKVIQGSRQRSSREIFEAVIEDVENFSRESGQNDDRTLVVIKLKGGRSREPG
ncbi:serine/threonine-protein phosphatase, partial [Acidobacteria bacterium AH-259-A15]|nr:serine/threonine-protein phosphatase [Acidobacteria bacterium AH-259-A15]